MSYQQGTYSREFGTKLKELAQPFVQIYRDCAQSDDAADALPKLPDYEILATLVETPVRSTAFRLIDDAAEGDGALGKGGLTTALTEDQVASLKDWYDFCCCRTVAYMNGASLVSVDTGTVTNPAPAAYERFSTIVVRHAADVIGADLTKNGQGVSKLGGDIVTMATTMPSATYRSVCSRHGKDIRDWQAVAVSDFKTKRKMAMRVNYAMQDSTDSVTFKGDTLEILGETAAILLVAALATDQIHATLGMVAVLASLAVELVPSIRRLVALFRDARTASASIMIT